jgi:hypothetical protein
LAGNITYFPLATNASLRNSSTGLYFAGLESSRNYYKSTTIDGDGRFQLAVPPGPGILLVDAFPGVSTDFLGP